MKIRRFYYDAMFELTHFIMTLFIGDQVHFNTWWDISESYRLKRDNAGS